jgi:hypothetical protein
MLQYKPLKRITEKSIAKTLKVTCIELTSAREKIIITALYRSPVSVLHEFFVHLIDILEQLLEKDCYIILVGDLNRNIQEDGCGHKQLLDVANIYKLTMTINTPAQITENMATIIDHIVTNTPAQCYSTDIINNLLSGHYTQCITINMTAPQQIRCYKEIRNVSEASI